MSPRRLRVRCAAKINLYLDVIGRRLDGYHDIETLFQPVSLCDEITIEESGAGVDLRGSDPSIPWDRSNLCWRAAEAAFGAAGREPAVSITVEKRIPAGAGLGGGSSDAAAVLAGLDALFGLGLGGERLGALALELGSDVPFFLLGSPAIGRGRGEILEPTDGVPGGWIVIGMPTLTISTSWAYASLTKMLTSPRGGPTLNALIEALKGFPDIALDTYNGFQGAAIERYPEIGEILAVLRDGGALLSAMSGSGSSCFALFGEPGAAAGTRERLTEHGYSAWVDRPARRALVLLQEG
ncbi:MAG: 4-(cytidine 5'-diphospho)-2-C-methyl-D-erythritol kinase [Candidatus Krumholzibacteria bacterium]|nr:4-(cytidine 5'-diphospho)-2-C-methyl-D-erythritol kinase [Candidatus Krumholzibacteria bacterium]